MSREREREREKDGALPCMCGGWKWKDVNISIVVFSLDPCRFRSLLAVREGSYVVPYIHSGYKKRSYIIYYGIYMVINYFLSILLHCHLVVLSRD